MWGVHLTEEGKTAHLAQSVCVGMLLWDALRPDTVVSVGQLPVGSLLQTETAGVTGRGASYQFIPTQTDWVK